MMNNSIPEPLLKLAKAHFGEKDIHFTALAQSGSARQYFRIKTPETSYVGAYSENLDENRAFLSFQNHFHSKGLPVPEVVAVSEDRKAWLLEDLGDQSLYNLIPGEGVLPGNETLIAWYKKVLKDLTAFQVEGHHGLDYSLAYPRSVFDERSIAWDLNYFKYYFLKLFTEDFDEDILEDGFELLIHEAMKPGKDFFMYRDFQARNIMLKEDVPYYIDFQGGRKGPLAYDVVSLLYQSRAKIHEEVREQLLDFYLEVLSEKVSVDKNEFRRQVRLFAFIRTLQVLGAYGYRGMIQNKPLFLKSIPKSVEYLKGLLPELEQQYGFKDFASILYRMIEAYSNSEKPKSSNLTVKVVSFSYLKGGLPADPSGNGGGHVFDCRALPNPGRHEQYKHLTGLDEQVKSFLQASPEVDAFLDNAFRIVSQSIDNYIEREFEHLMISFGCTGGQHRSVYGAEELAHRIKQRYDVDVQILHFQKEIGY